LRRPVFGGREMDEIPLLGEIVIGRAEDADLVLPDPRVSRQHARIDKTTAGFRVVSLTERAESRVNGSYFDQHDLVIGDRVQFGPYAFHFDGRVLRMVAGVSGGTVEAVGLTRSMHGAEILKNVSLHAGTCQFIGILGPSGSGKSTLLGALSGLRPADSGTVRINGVDLYSNLDAMRTHVGYVPQEDIVHRELAVREALIFSARLRLPRGTPRFEIEKLVMITLARLGLSDRASTRIGRLSGGQIKRVSVAVELLARPPVLFLDEPGSGLDPATEFRLMELLRQLAGAGCTVLCTTHVMENVFLMDQLVVLLDGRLVFEGSAEEARAHFGVQRLTLLYDRLQEAPASEWVRRVEESRGATAKAEAPVPSDRRAPRAKKPFWSVLSILLERQWAILRADPRNLAIIAGQPVAIGALVSWASDDVSLILFFAYIATLWFGCSNGVQEIVKEAPIYRRERIVGLGRGAYLLSKFIAITGITVAQAALLYGCFLIAEGGMRGSLAWQSAALCATALTGTGIGLAISALARTSMQAVMAVPLVLIPLILFSGFTIKVNEMSRPVLGVSRFTPAFSAQTMMDVSLLWGREMSHSGLSRDFPALINVRAYEKDVKTGEVFRRAGPGLASAGVLAGWVAAAWLLASLALRRKHEER
jgi:ABC-type multidrug transport system ATPase subunit